MDDLDVEAATETIHATTSLILSNHLRYVECHHKIQDPAFANRIATLSIQYIFVNT